MAVQYRALPPRDAIAALRTRGYTLAGTFAWQEIYAAEHAAMFTVAKSAGFDILQDIYDGLLAALEEGKTFREFSRELVPLLEAKGWWGREQMVNPQTGQPEIVQLGSPRRLQTIFDANMRVSYAAGQWASFERNKAARPYLRYVAVMDEATRDEHAAMHNVCLPVDDPTWDIWTPPNGWRCRCTLQSLSVADVEAMQGVLKMEAPTIDLKPWTNRVTGEVRYMPEGIQPGWDYNPGKAGHEATLARLAEASHSFL